MFKIPTDEWNTRIFVCELTHVLDATNPSVEWLEPIKIRGCGCDIELESNYASSLVVGNDGELIYFEGLDMMGSPEASEPGVLYFITAPNTKI
ncbi:hypothetical protein DMENIID0001_001010 [Sergentomyia squamirostris]